MKMTAINETGDHVMAVRSVAGGAMSEWEMGELINVCMFMYLLMNLLPRPLSKFSDVEPMFDVHMTQLIHDQ